MKVDVTANSIFCSSFVEHNNTFTAQITTLQGVFCYDTPYLTHLEGEATALLFALKYAMENNIDATAFISCDLYRYYCGYSVQPFNYIVEYALAKIYQYERYHVATFDLYSGLGNQEKFTIKRFKVRMEQTELMKEIFTKKWNKEMKFTPSEFDKEIRK